MPSFFYNLIMNTIFSHWWHYSGGPMNTSYRYLKSWHTIATITEAVLDGKEISQDQALDLIHCSDQDTPILLAMADKIKEAFADQEVDLCAIINGRSGKCPENCKFCAQSSHYNTGVEVYSLLSKEAILEAAQKAKEGGAVRF